VSGRRDREIEKMIREVVAVLAVAMEEQHARDAGARGAGTAGEGRMAHRLCLAESARTDAADLASAVQAGRAAAADALLLAHRTEPEWRRLALLLAASADLGHLLTGGGTAERSAA